MKTTSYSLIRNRRLADPQVAVEYLNQALAESHEVFLKALFTVAQARQMSKVAKEAGLQRETLYRSLSEQGNPTLSTLDAVLSALDLSYEIVAAKKEPTTPPRQFNQFGYGQSSPLITRVSTGGPLRDTAPQHWFRPLDTITAGYTDPRTVGSLIETLPSFPRATPTSTRGEYADEYPECA